ncbi:hypothetical protein Esti_005760 [Eimeria stiedai]
MRVSHPAIEMLAWVSRCSSDVRPLHLSSLVIFPPPPLRHSNQQVQPALTHHCANVTTSSPAEDEVLKHLRDTPASEGLRLLVSELRRQEAARHQTRRRERNQQGEARMSSISGLLPIVKPSGITSADVCRVVRYVLRNTETTLPQHLSEDLLCRSHAETSGNNDQQRRLRVGHGGTLDPAASGVLVVGIGRGTVALQFLLNGSTEYVARIRLGIETDTLDAEGTETRQASWEHINLSQLADVVSSFQGEYAQRPPLYSAKRVRGRRLYEAARDGSVLLPEELPAPCRVKIESIQLHRNPRVNLPDFDIFTRCSKGTYIRQLAADIAAAAGSVGHVRLLVRTRQGPFRMEDCLPLDSVPDERLLEHIIPLDAIQLNL